MASTLDVISSGRLEFGIGAGWFEQEYRAYGYDFPGGATRLRQLKESLRLIKKLLSGEKTSFKGRFFRIRDAICNPKPLQKPHHPIWVGGNERQLKAGSEARGLV